jgi:hypothetical protein
VTDEVILKTTYPQCVQTYANPANVHVAVHATTGSDPLSFASSVRVTFGMALWLSMVTHIICMEFYVRGRFRFEPIKELTVINFRFGRPNLKINIDVDLFLSVKMMNWNSKELPMITKFCGINLLLSYSQFHRQWIFFLCAQWH